MTTVAIQRWGNSQGIRLPKTLLDALDWRINEKLNVIFKEDKLILEQTKGRKKINDLFANFEGEYMPAEFDWGKPVGKEVW